MGKRKGDVNFSTGGRNGKCRVDRRGIAETKLLGLEGYGEVLLWSHKYLAELLSL